MGQKYGFILPNFGSVTNQEKKPMRFAEASEAKGQRKGFRLFSWAEEGRQRGAEKDRIAPLPPE